MTKLLKNEVLRLNYSTWGLLNILNIDHSETFGNAVRFSVELEVFRSFWFFWIQKYETIFPQLKIKSPILKIPIQEGNHAVSCKLSLSLYVMRLAAEFLRKHSFSIYLKFHNAAFLRRLFYISGINIIQIHIVLKILSFHPWKKYLILKYWKLVLMVAVEPRGGGKASAYGVLKGTSRMFSCSMSWPWLCD